MQSILYLRSNISTTMRQLGTAQSSWPVTHAHCNDLLPTSKGPSTLNATWLSPCHKHWQPLRALLSIIEKRQSPNHHQPSLLSPNFPTLDRQVLLSHSIWKGLTPMLPWMMTSRYLLPFQPHPRNLLRKQLHYRNIPDLRFENAKQRFSSQLLSSRLFQRRREGR